MQTKHGSDGTDQTANYDQDEMGVLAFVLVNNELFPFMFKHTD